MRKSSFPSQRGKLPLVPAASGAGSSCGGGGGGGDDDTETLHRVSIFPELYSKDDLSRGMVGKVADSHVHRDFKRPAQDPTKVQFFDPDRARKSLGGSKPGSKPAARPPPSLSLNAGVPKAEEAADDFNFEPLVLWEPPPEEEEDGAAAAADADADAAAPAAGEGEGAGGSEVADGGETTAGDGDVAMGGAAAAAPPAGKKAPRPKPVSVDPKLCRYLRAHQREGTQFLFDCLMGQREYAGCGCILADDMGLGKTLQSITILWTLMTQGMTPDGKPAVTHSIVTCPVSLVTNWESELNKKWIGSDRLKARGIDVIGVSEATKKEVKAMIQRFSYARSAVLIISYETFRIHEKLFKKGNQAGLLICDEAHRLKNKETKTAMALSALQTRRRVLLSGTPIQNDLDEFYSMVHFANPDLLGTQHDFHRLYQNPILRGREPDATDKDRAKGEAKASELGKLVNQFILRRTNTLLSDHLPPKLVCVVCCSMSSLQLQMYKTFLAGKAAKEFSNGGRMTDVLPAITSLKKLCNHPALIIDEHGKVSEGCDDIVKLLPPSAGHHRKGQAPPLDPTLSGKFHVLYKLLRGMRATTDDKVVLVSNYTQTLDLFERMCVQEGWKCCKLDGSCSIKKRTKMVEDFNDPRGGLFAFLLSSKAGGCGLNLIGGNRLVLFDPDWNPANDKQAAARVWRDGQKKKCYLYRMVCAGSIEEKVFERQLSKEGLSGVATNENIEQATMCKSELKDLFALHEELPSHLHEKLVEQGLVGDGDGEASMEDSEEGESDGEDGGAGVAGDGAAKGKGKKRPPGPRSSEEIEKPQEGWPKETGDLHLWGHHLGCETVDDPLLRDAGRKGGEDEGYASFVFSLQVRLACVLCARGRVGWVGRLGVAGGRGVEMQWAGMHAAASCSDARLAARSVAARTAPAGRRTLRHSLWVQLLAHAL